MDLPSQDAAEDNTSPDQSTTEAAPSPRQAGEAQVKKEFLVVERVRVENNGEKEADGGADASEPLEKRQKLSRQEKKKLKGQNKKRPPPMKLTFAQRLCPTLVDVAEGEEPKPCTFPGCAYQHDVDQFLASKPPDLGEECHVFNTYGRCPRGLSCRFSKKHIVGHFNVINHDLIAKHAGKQFVFNSLSKELQTQLRKHKYEFSRSERLISKFNCKPKKKDDANATVISEGVQREAESKSAVNNVNECVQESEEKSTVKTEDISDNTADATSKLGPVTDEDTIPLRQEEKKKIDWKDLLYLAPLTTVGNLPFRRICKEYGADITCSEMAMATSLLHGGQQEWALVKRHHSESIFGVQLCGNNPYVVGKCAQLLEENIEMDFLDLNLGCPIDLVYQQGGGSGLMRRERPLQAIVNCASRLISVPLTVKMRTGVYMDHNIAHRLAPLCLGWGASLVTVHGRSREQRYTRQADWDYVNECAKLAAPSPLFGNGDVLSYEDYEARRKETDVCGIMVARGALIKPWIFTEIKERRHWDISSEERFAMLKKYVNHGLEHWGSDSQGVENTRRFLLEWLSFLHRYIPVGILEHPPQKINERPPFYRGRDDMETLMASTSSADWVKISEMLLGPVPDSFVFLPKHKANSWK